MTIGFYEQVPRYRWDIPVFKRLKRRLFKSQWSTQKYVNYIHDSLIAKAECDIQGWDNYSGSREPTRCENCDESNAIYELVPIYLSATKKFFEEDRKNTKFTHPDYIAEVIEAVINTLHRDSGSEYHAGNPKFKLLNYSKDLIRDWLRQRMTVYNRLFKAGDFGSILSMYKKFHGCDNPSCMRITTFDQHCIREYLEYLVDGFSFLKIVG